VATTLEKPGNATATTEQSRFVRRASDMPVLGKTRFANLPPAALYEHAIRRDEGILAANGPLVVRTGKHTGRSPKDKFIVDEPDAHEGVWWGGFNTPISRERYDALRRRFIDHMNKRQVFVQDAFVGADPRYRRSVRAYTETAWASIFVDNLFIRPTEQDLKDFVPNFTIIDAPSFKANPERDGTRSETVILVNLAKQEIFIGGTEYAGEIKKGAFGIMNYRLPAEGVLPMHSSVNVGRDGDVAIFFGLSGTGKTTLSADPERVLIGDDEHGWSDDGVFNFEGGCYAKTIRLSHIYEPDIYTTTQRFGTILENVAIDPDTRKLNLDSEELTENTRAAFPLSFIGNSSEHGMAGQPSTIIFLTADAFGVLPPVARLTRDQAMYHFISGYTAKLAGTEVGVKEPSAPRRHRKGPRQGAGADLLDLLRRPVHAAPPQCLRRDARRANGPPQRPGLADQHRLDGRAIRRWRAAEHHLDAPDGARGAQRCARRRPDANGSDLRRGGSHACPRCPGRGSLAARHVGR